MVRLRIALGVASSLVAVAALTIVFSGTGQAQGSGTGPNVFVTNTPLPVTGNLTATIPGTVNVSGNVNAAVTGDVNATVTGNVNAAVTGDVNATVTGPVTVNNPSNNPVLIRDVDAQGAKELWQVSRSISMGDGTLVGDLVFGPVPAGKALVVQHISFIFQNLSNLSTGLAFTTINTTSFTEPGFNIQYLVPETIPNFGIIGDKATTFYVAPGGELHVSFRRFNSVGVADARGTATGYLVNYP